MHYSTIPGLDRQMSRICLGTMVINRNDAAKSFELMDAALAAGINTFDCAIVYGGGNSERCIGDWMQARNNRADVVICSKGCHHDSDRNRVTPYDLTADIMTSLARLQSSYIDLYMLHRDDLQQPVRRLIATK